MKTRIKSIIIKSIFIILVIAAVAVGCYFLLKNADFMQLKTELGDTIWFWLIIGLLQIVQVIFIPISNQVITVPCALLFKDDLWKVWLTSWISIWIATIILYFIGRFAGKKLLNWILNDEDTTNKCTDFLNRGWVFYPLGMLLPLPDDVVTVLAGTSKMNFWFVLGCSFITRAIDTACSVFGFGILTKYWWGWIVIAVGIILLGLATVLFWKIDKKIRAKKELNQTSK